MADISPDRPAGDVPFDEIFDMDAAPSVELPPGPVIVAVARDEMLRLPDYLRHHRGIGVRHFLIVDNASTDGTGAYLDAQPDVTRFFSERHFPTFKPLFRPWLADTHAVGRWVLAPDLDEHLVYPGWPDRRLDALLAHWEGEGCDAVFAPMVDMYSDRPLSRIEHGPEARLAQVYSHFDAEGYWLAPPKPRSLKRSPTPPAMLFGGARDRFARTAEPDIRDRMTRAVVRRFMDHRNPAHPRRGAWLLHRHFMLRRFKRGPRSKVPLIRWRRGLRYPASNHRVNAALKLAPDWIALLHFRLMVDHVEKEAAWDVRNRRASDARLSRHAALARSDLMWEGSRRFTGWRDLEEAGLVRVSDALGAALGLSG